MRRNKYSTNLWRQDVNPGRLLYRFWALKTSRPTSLKARPTTVWKRCSSQTNGEKKRASVLTSCTSLSNCSLTDCAPCDADTAAAACQTAVHLHKPLPLRAVFQSHTGDMEQPPRRTVDFNSVHRNICRKTQKSSLRLLAPLRNESFV